MADDVRFRLVGGQNPLILLPVYVEEKGPYEFILDTGASHCLISPELALTLGTKIESEKDAMGAGGPVKLKLGRVSSIVVGAAQCSNVQVAITDELRRIGAAIQSRVDGDLGFDFLKNFVLIIDYRKCVLRLVPPSDSAQPGSMSFKLASASKPLILVPAIVNGEGPFQFALDTGASKTMLSMQLAQRLALQTTDDGPATGGGGQVKILSGNVASLTVGGATVRNHSISAGEFLKMLSTAIGAELDGILGYNFLNQFKLIINYPHRTLEFAPTLPPSRSACSEYSGPQQNRI